MGIHMQKKGLEKILTEGQKMEGEDAEADPAGLYLVDKLRDFRQGAAEMDAGRYLSHQGPGQLTGNDQGDAGNALTDLGEEFFEVEIAGNGRHMRIQVIRLFDLADEFHIAQGNIGPQVQNLDPMSLQEIIYIKQPHLMMFPLGKE
jgi:hypothetical protein